jgi:transposase-like protein
MASVTNSPPRSPRSGRSWTPRRRGIGVHHLPRGRWAKVWSTNPLERINKEIKRRARVVCIFPNEDAVIRLVGAVLHDTARRCVSLLVRFSSVEDGTVSLDRGVAARNA